MHRAARAFTVDHLGVDLKGSKLAHVEGETVHFLVTSAKQPNYLRHCSTQPEHDAYDVVQTFQKYTDHTTQYCTKLNLALASDSATLSELGPYCSQLHHSILRTVLNPIDHLPVYRGVDLSPQEAAEMEALHNFFIPSFTSTSADRTKAYKQPCLLVIKPAWSQRAATVTPALSKFHADEKEVLITAYTAFVLERVELDGGKRIMTLSIDDTFSDMTALSSSPYQRQ